MGWDVINLFKKCDCSIALFRLYCHVSVCQRLKIISFSLPISGSTGGLKAINLSWKSLPPPQKERYCEEAAATETAGKNAPLTPEQRERKIQKHLRQLKIEVCNKFKMFLLLPTDTICGNVNYLNLDNGERKQWKTFFQAMLWGECERKQKPGYQGYVIYFKLICEYI